MSGGTRRSCGTLVAALALVAASCGPWDPVAGHVTDEVAAPQVRLTAARPRASFRFTVTGSDVAVSNARSIGFTIEGDALGLGYRDGPLLPVDVAVWRVGGPTPERVELRRGWCRGAGCVGEFLVIFRRWPSATSPVIFDWSIGAVINFDGPAVPDGATLDIGISVAA